MSRLLFAMALAVSVSGMAAAQAPYQPLTPMPLPAPYPNVPMAQYPGQQQQQQQTTPGALTGKAQGQGQAQPIPAGGPLVYPKDYFQKTAQQMNAQAGVGPVDPSVTSGKYGWHPWLRVFHSHKGGACDGCEGSHGLFHGKLLSHLHGDGSFRKTKFVEPPPVAEGGTLVFPHHPYVRSPRDWFQQD